MMEVDEDENTWAELDEESELANKDPVTTAISAISRLAEAVGEKTTLSCA
jgi:hypothetical protein